MEYGEILNYTMKPFSGKRSRFSVIIRSTNRSIIVRMMPQKYIETISKPSSWGGAIELGILAAHFGTEIDSIDVETGRIDKFTPPEGFTPENRCLLIYSGIHYDAVTLAPMKDAPADWHQTVFPVGVNLCYCPRAFLTLFGQCLPDDVDPIIPAVKELADILRKKKAFTNTATFDLKCEVCTRIQQYDCVLN
jgi:ubiquitin thioesterase OTU1